MAWSQPWLQQQQHWKQQQQFSRALLLPPPPPSLVPAPLPLFFYTHIFSLWTKILFFLSLFLFSFSIPLFLLPPTMFLLTSPQEEGSDKQMCLRRKLRWPLRCYRVTARTGAKISRLYPCGCWLEQEWNRTVFALETLWKRGFLPRDDKPSVVNSRESICKPNLNDGPETGERESTGFMPLNTVDN